MSFVILYLFMTANLLQEELFYHIRKQEVVLFVGAGFSAYAGYPLGSKLVAELQQLLPESLGSTATNRSLDQFTEAIVRKCGSRDLLNGLLDQIFTAQPTATTDHEHLARLPFFNTIITTNYDTLFETAYGDQANLMWRDEHIGHWDDRKVNILKIHGHIADKSSIVLTQSDYAEFITRDFSSPLWTAVLNQLATRHTLFIGYGYEDPNLWALVKKLTKQLNGSQKRMFLISPGNDPEKVAFWKSQGIEYVQHSGATFLEALSTHIKYHLLKDLESGLISAETARTFSRTQNASLTIEDTPDGFRIRSIGAVTGSDETWNAKLTFQSDGKAVDRLQAFQNSNELLEIELDASELQKFELAFKGLHVLDQDELGKILVKKIPKEVKFDLSFLKEGWEANGLHADIYWTKGAARILTNIYGLSVEVNVVFTGPKIDHTRWDFKRSAQYGTVSSETSLYTFLLHFFSQKEFTLFLTDDDYSITTKAPKVQESYLKQCKAHLKYLGWLQQIERAFGTRFGNLGEIDEPSWNTAKMLADIIDGKNFPIAAPCRLSAGELDEAALVYFEKLNDLINDNGPLVFLLRENKTFLLHGQQLVCKGRRISVESPVVDNMVALRSGQEQVLLVSSKTGKLWEQLTIEPEKELLV